MQIRTLDLYCLFYYEGIQSPINDTSEKMQRKYLRLGVVILMFSNRKKCYSSNNNMQIVPLRLRDASVFQKVRIGQFCFQLF